jgi:hypothetical protein
MAAGFALILGADASVATGAVAVGGVVEAQAANKPLVKPNRALTLTQE